MQHQHCVRCERAIQSPSAQTASILVNKRANRQWSADRFCLVSLAHQVTAAQDPVVPTTRNTTARRWAMWTRSWQNNHRSLVKRITKMRQTLVALGVRFRANCGPVQTDLAVKRTKYLKCWIKAKGKHMKRLWNCVSHSLTAFPETTRFRRDFMLPSRFSLSLGQMKVDAELNAHGHTAILNCPTAPTASFGLMVLFAANQPLYVLH